nr:MAG: replication initiator protein [Microvirus sp.]
MCTSPRTASFNPDGSINFSKKHHNKEMVPFQLPCGKCVECLLERARDWSVRCMHEAKMHAQNAFITLTYAPEHYPKDGKLNHYDFQLFMMRLRKHFKQDGIGFFMCGEYGEETGRAHYHACLFGIDFDDKKPERENKHGDQIWSSNLLTELWGLGHTELGTVSQKSAGYVARYILKKQNPDSPQGYQKMSRKNAIGKRFVEKWFKDIFINAGGSVILDDGTKTKCPRYYEKWLKDNHPEIWAAYVTETKQKNTERLRKKAEQENAIYLQERNARTGNKTQHDYKSPLARKREILKHKQKQLKRSYL